MIPISICIIGKNEEKNIETCLSSIPKNIFEIIYVDTGSSDKTIQIAKKYTDKIFHFTWIDDFSAARKFSIEKASNDWILVIDCDENITYISMEEIQSLITKHPTSVGLLLRNNLAKDSSGVSSYFDRVERLFNRVFFHYVGTIHEQVLPISSSHPFSSFTIPLELLHTGYVGNEKDIAEKADRNINLLKKELESDSENPYLLFQLGQSYYLKRDYESSVPYFAKALSFDLDPNASFVKILVVSYGYALYYTNALKDAIIICEEIYNVFSKYANFIFLCGFLYMKAGLWEKAILNFILCTTLSDQMSSVAPIAYYNLGCIYELLGEKKLALAFFSKNPKFNDSKARIQNIRRTI